MSSGRSHGVLWCRRETCDVLILLFSQADPFFVPFFRLTEPRISIAGRYSVDDPHEHPLHSAGHGRRSSLFRQQSSSLVRSLFPPSLPLPSLPNPFSNTSPSSSFAVRRLQRRERRTHRSSRRRRRRQRSTSSSDDSEKQQQQQLCSRSSSSTEWRPCASIGVEVGEGTG